MAKLSGKLSVLMPAYNEETIIYENALEAARQISPLADDYELLVIDDGSSDRKAAIPGLAVGCLITNLLSPYGLLDLVVGTLATLLAGVWSGRCRSAWTAAAMLAWESTGFSAACAGLFAYNALTVGIGEAAVCFLLGVPLLRTLEKRAIA